MDNELQQNVVPSYACLAPSHPLPAELLGIRAEHVGSIVVQRCFVAVASAWLVNVWEGCLPPYRLLSTNTSPVHLADTAHSQIVNLSAQIAIFGSVELSRGCV